MRRNREQQNENVLRNARKGLYSYFEHCMSMISILLQNETMTEMEDYTAVLQLSPWITYTFRVLAVNSFGRGASKYLDHPEDRCTTPPAPPHINPAGVVVNGTRPDNLVIWWKVLLLCFVHFRSLISDITLDAISLCCSLELNVSLR